jgi:hypothetical protein
MPISFAKKTRKHCKKNKRDCNKDAKKGTQLKCRLKTCRAKKYQAVYGATRGGSARETRPLFY